MATLELHLLGGFAARAGAALPPLGRKAQLLLAYLALRPGEAQTREKIIGILWSDRGDRQARGSLRQELTALRRLLGGIDPPPVVIDGERLLLDAATVAVDVGQFEQLIQSDATPDLERAVALYRGPFLDGLAVRDAACEEWLQHERERLRLLMLGVLDRLLARQLKSGALARATATADVILAHDPLREDTHRTLMQLHAAQGRHSLALKQYQACSEVLARELGVEPEPETVRLHQEIQAHRAAPARPPASETRSAAIGATMPPELPTVAVLPFANISGDPEQEYFADGLTEDIITDLSRVSALFVVARNTVFTFKGKAVQVQEAARALNVRYVLEGSVRKAAGRVRITAQLVDGRTGGHLWANRYDRGLADIFTLQDEISRSIVDALKVKLLPEELAAIAKRSTTDADAYQYYLMGRAYFLQSGWGKRALGVARRMFTKAAEIDPCFARAYAGIANCDSYLLCMGDPGVSFEDILANGTRALELEPDLADAHAAKGLALYTAGRHAEADAALEQAVRLGPTSFEAHFFAARNCRAQGRYAEAAALFERAAELQPVDFRALGLAVNAYRSLGRREDMLSAARRCLERAEAEVAVHPDNAGALAFGAAMLTEVGDKARAEAWVDRAATLDPVDSITSYNLACAYVGLGKLEPALERLRQVFSDPPASRRSHVEWLKHDSSFEPLRGHPDFVALLRRLDAETNPPALGSERRPAVAVLPLDDLSGDQAYFSDGLTEDLITALTLWRSFLVIARNSTFSFKGRTVDVKQVALELGAGYIVEGSVRKAGGRVRVAVQLIDGATGHHVWAGKYDRELHDIFALQDELTLQIAAVVAPELERAEVKRAGTKRPGDFDAWDFYLRGVTLLTQFTAAGNRAARTMFEQAISLDPEYADACTGLAVSHNRDLLLQCTADREASLRHAMAAARRAVALDPSSAAAHSVLGTVHIWRGENDLALAEARLAFDLNPYDALNLHSLGNKSDLAGDPEGIECMVRAQQLNPLDPDRHSHLCFLARAYVNARRYDEAEAAARAALQRRPDYPHAHFILAIVLAHLGREAEARAALARCEQAQPGFAASRADWRPYVDDAANRHLREGLRKAGPAPAASSAS